ncbi:MAG: hypothetical protein JWM49_2117 [Microbacteriaceae bacterium]|nr:hypothetical protein [Microbacteriaceae bacterium]
MDERAQAKAEKKQEQVDKKAEKKAEKDLHGTYDTSVGAPARLGAPVALGPHGSLTLLHGMVSYWDNGNRHVRSVVGATAEFDIGATLTRGARSSLTRVAVGGLVAGKTGALVGGQFQKDRADLTQVFVTVTWPDGGWAQGAAPAAAERAARQAVQRINAASRFYASFDQPLPLVRSASKTTTVSLYLDRVEWIVGTNVETIAIRDITAVKSPNALLNATVSLTTTYETAIELSVMRGDALLIRDALNELIAGRHPDLRTADQGSVTVPDSTPAVTDPATQLHQLAALRDAGILTEDEFSAKKTEILSRM